MKYLIYFFLFTVTTSTLKAQISYKKEKCEIDSINGMVVHSTAEVLPEYEGGLQKFYSDISSKIKIKKSNNLSRIKVILTFIVDVDGNIKNFCLTENVDITDEEIASLNNWTPGKIGGVNVPVRMYLPMYIKLG